jgi:hypothetical protein
VTLPVRTSRLSCVGLGLTLGLGRRLRIRLVSSPLSHVCPSMISCLCLVCRLSGGLLAFPSVLSWSWSCGPDLGLGLGLGIGLSLFLSGRSFPALPYLVLSGERH